MCARVRVRNPDVRRGRGQARGQEERAQLDALHTLGTSEHTVYRGSCRTSADDSAESAHRATHCDFRSTPMHRRLRFLSTVTTVKKEGRRIYSYVCAFQHTHPSQVRSAASYRRIGSTNTAPRTSCLVRLGAWWSINGSLNALGGRLVAVRSRRASSADSTARMRATS